MSRKQRFRALFAGQIPDFVPLESQHEIVVARLQCLLRVKTQGPPCIFDVILKMAKDYVDLAGDGKVQLQECLLETFDGSAAPKSRSRQDPKQEAITLSKASKVWTKGLLIILSSDLVVTKFANLLLFFTNFLESFPLKSPCWGCSTICKSFGHPSALGKILKVGNQIALLTRRDCAVCFVFTGIAKLRIRRNFELRMWSWNINFVVRSPTKLMTAMLDLVPGCQM